MAIAMDDPKEILFFKVGRRTDDHVIQYSECAEYELSGKIDYVDIVCECVLNRTYPEDAEQIDVPLPRKSSSHIEISAKTGKFVYVVWLGSLANTDFGQSFSPVSAKTSFYPPFEKCITDVKLYYKYVDQAGKKKVFVSDEDNKWDPPVGVDFSEPKWASFIFDTKNPSGNAIKEVIELAVKKKQSHTIPLFYNLFVFGEPNTKVANHARDHGAKGHNHKHGKIKLGGLTHGGPHPGNPENDFIIGP